VFTPDGTRVLAADQSNAVFVYSLSRARAARAGGDAPADAPEPLLALLQGHTGAVNAIALFPDAPTRVQSTDDFYRRSEIATGSADGTVRIWRLCTPDEELDRRATAPAHTVERQARRVMQHGAPVTAIAYSPSGRWLVSGAADGTAIAWDEQCRKLRRYGPLDGPVTVMQVQDQDDHAESMLVVRAGIGVRGRTTVFELDTGAPIDSPAQPKFAAPTAAHLAIAVVPLPAQALLSLVGGEQMTLGGHDAPVIGRAATNDFSRALTWATDGTIHVHDWLVRGPDGAPVLTTLPFVVLWLALAALVFTLLYRGVNLRLLGHAIGCARGRYRDPQDIGEVSPGQALATALAGSMGLGAIAGVAVAVAIGGPGATVWLVVAGLLGMALKFAEGTLGQRFRTRDALGTVSGGPMHYLKDGIAQRWPRLAPLGVALAALFGVFCIGASLAGGNAFQVNQSLGMLRTQVPFFDDHPWAYGLLLAALCGLVTLGGIRSIAAVAGRVVPWLCGVYVLAGLVVILAHLGDLPRALLRIGADACRGDAIYGGALGALIAGCRRAALGDGAGTGAAAIAHATARTTSAVRQGLVALLEPLFATVVVGTATALVLTVTGAADAPANAELVAAGNGGALAARAFASVGVLQPWFPWLLLIALVLFAYATMIAWSYYGERCATNLFGARASLPFRLLFLAFTVLGSILTATSVLEFGDLMILLMAFPNVLGLYLLGGVVRRDLRDYEQQLRSGAIRVQQ